MNRTAACRIATALPATRVVAARRVQPQTLKTIRFKRNYATPSPAPAAGSATNAYPAGAAGSTGGGSSGGSGGGHNVPMYIVLGALALLGGGGYWYLKPVRDAAALANQAVGAVKDKAGNLGDLDISSLGSSSLSGIAQSMLPPSAFAIYSTLASSPGGINGLFSSLKDGDIQNVLDEVKKHGGDEVKRIVEKVEKKVKAANGKITDVDWKSLATELKGELPKNQQHMVDMLIGYIPGKEDIDGYVQKLKDEGKDSLKQIESAASKILKEVEKAKKDGKNQADSFLAGLKQAAPADVDSLIEQLKEAAKKAGLPADQAESWLKSKVNDNKVDAEAFGNQVVDKLRTASKFIPGNPKELIDQVNQVSPSTAQLLLGAMQQAGIVDAKGNRK